jgi:hypothetical protein
MMPLPSGDLHNVFCVDRVEVIPDGKNITVRCIMEKNHTTGASEVKLAAAGSQTNSTDAVVSMLGVAVRKSMQLNQ